MAEKPQNGQNQVEPAEEQDELMKDYDALVISAKDLPPYESDMDTDFSEEFKSDLESLKKNNDASSKVQKASTSKDLTEEKKSIKVQLGGVVKRYRNLNYRPVQPRWYNPRFEYFRPNPCILCMKQGIRDGIFHLRRNCPFLRICINASGEKLCFTCKKTGHIAKFCPNTSQNN